MRGTSGSPASRRSIPPRPQWVRPVGGDEGRHARTPAAIASVRIAAIRQPRRVVGRLDRCLRVEPRTLRRPRDLRVGRDVLALAEEASYSACLNARRRRDHRPRGTRRAGASSAAGSAGGGSRRRGQGVTIDVLRPIGAEVVAAGHEQGAGGRAKLERQPLDLDPAGILGRLDGVRLEVRVGADDVVVESEPLHGVTEYARPMALDVSQIRLDPDPYVPVQAVSGLPRRRPRDRLRSGRDRRARRPGRRRGLRRAGRAGLRNLQRVLEAGGSSLDRIVKVTIFLTDMANFPKIVELRGRWFTEPYPADTIVEVTALACPSSRSRSRQSPSPAERGPITRAKQAPRLSSRRRREGPRP